MVTCVRCNQEAAILMQLQPSGVVQGACKTCLPELFDFDKDGHPYTYTCNAIPISKTEPSIPGA